MSVSAATGRPKIVPFFETLSIILIAVDLVVSPPEPWEKMLWAALSFWLVLMISRRGRKWARVAWTLLLGAGLLLTFWVMSYVELALPWHQWILQLAIWAGYVIQLGLLWSPAMSVWIADREEARRLAAVEKEAASR